MDPLVLSKEGPEVKEQVWRLPFHHTHPSIFLSKERALINPFCFFHRGKADAA